MFGAAAVAGGGASGVRSDGGLEALQASRPTVARQTPEVRHVRVIVGAV
jgi:hypothetical protein